MHTVFYVRHELRPRKQLTLKVTIEAYFFFSVRYRLKLKNKLKI